MEILPTENEMLEISDDEQNDARAIMPPPSIIPAAQAVNKKDAKRPTTTNKKADDTRPARSTRSKQTTRVNINTYNICIIEI